MLRTYLFANFAHFESNILTDPQRKDIVASAPIVISLLALIVSIANIVISGKRAQKIWTQTQIMEYVLNYWEAKQNLDVIGSLILEEHWRSYDQDRTPRWAMQVVDKYTSIDAGDESRNIRVAFGKFASATVPLMHIVDDSRITSALKHQRQWAQNIMRSWADARMDLTDLASSKSPTTDSKEFTKFTYRLIESCHSPASMIQFEDIGVVIWKLYLPSRPGKRRHPKIKMVDQSHLSEYLKS